MRKDVVYGELRGKGEERLEVAYASSDFGSHLLGTFGCRTVVAPPIC